MRVLALNKETMKLLSLIFIFLMQLPVQAYFTEKQCVDLKQDLTNEWQIEQKSFNNKNWQAFDTALAFINSNQTTYDKYCLHLDVSDYSPTQMTTQIIPYFYPIVYPPFFFNNHH